jgi:hypothetical protein
MKTIVALAVALATSSVPAFAQNAGAPGATGTSGPLTGSNTGTGFAPNYHYGPYPNGGYYGGAPGWDGQDAYNYENPGAIDAPAPYYGPSPYYGGPPGMIEGRAAAIDRDHSDNPRTVRGDQNGQDRNWW